jgi:hypothetical protein
VDANKPVRRTCLDCDAREGEMHDPLCRQRQPPPTSTRTCCRSAQWERHRDDCHLLAVTAPATPAGPVASTGGSSSYYAIPEDATDLQDLIEQKEMSFARGNLFKALFRMGEKEGIDVGYDLNKLQWFLDRMKRMHQQGRRL